MTRTTMIPSVQSINNRVREAAAEASNFFGQNTPLIAALNAEYAGYTMLNATLGTTYGQVISAATLPIPIPPPPPLGNAAKAAGEAGSAIAEAGQVAGRVGSQSLTQATQASSQVSQGTGATNPMGAMTQLGQLVQGPMSALQPLTQAPMQLMQQVLGPVTQLFGQASGMGNMFGGGSTGDAFSPLLAGGGGGLPLGGAGLTGGAGAGGGLGAGGGAGGIGAGGGGGGLGAGGLGTLSAKSENATITRGGTVLSGVTSPGVTGDRVTTAGGGGGMPMGHGGQGSGGDRVRRDAVMTSSPPSFLDLPRRA
jgi:PPE-repeat protein